MSYGVGVDVGTTFTAAAICRYDGKLFTSPEAVGLGIRSTATTSIVYIGDGGQWLFGDTAERRGYDRPDLVVREFKRRLGDPIPVVIGGQRHKPELIAAHLVRWVVDRAAEQEGSAAAAIAVTHPASWGSYKRSLMQRAIEEVGLADVSFLSEPVAAATNYAAQARVGIGSTIAVYDLGGGTFDAAVVRKLDEQTFEVLGTPHGIDRLGGLDFDEAVFSQVRQGVRLPPVDPTDADAVAAIACLRRECTEAKEALSADTDATIRVMFPDLHTRVRVVRAEFEDLIHDAVENTIDALCATIDSAGVGFGQIDAVLLVGGSSRIPLVGQLVSARLGRPVVVDADPKATIALGAAHVAASEIRAGPPKRTPGVAAAFCSTVQPTRVASVKRRRHHKVGAATLGAGVAVIAGAAVAIGWPPDSDRRARIVEAGITIDDVAGSDGARASGSETMGRSTKPAVELVSGSDRFVPIAVSSPAVAADPASAAEDANSTGGDPSASSLVAVLDPSSVAPSQSRKPGSTGSTAQPNGSAQPSSDITSGPGEPVEPATSDPAASAQAASGPQPATDSDLTTAAAPQGSANTAPASAGIPYTTSPADPPDTTPPSADPTDTTPPTDPPDTTPPPADPTDTTPPADPPEAQTPPTDLPDTEPQQTDPPTESEPAPSVDDPGPAPAENDPV